MYISLGSFLYEDASSGGNNGSVRCLEKLQHEHEPSLNFDPVKEIQTLHMRFLKQHTEEYLLYRVRDNDKEAFDEIYNRYSTKPHGYVRKYVKVPSQVEDIVQDAFLKVWEIRETIDPEKYFSGYLFTITRNLVFKFLKTAANSNDVFDEMLINVMPINSEPVNLIEWRELADGIRQAIHELPPKRRKVFLLCKDEQLSYDEVSAQLGISRNTVKEHMVLAMKHIKAVCGGASTALCGAM